LIPKCVTIIGSCACTILRGMASVRTVKSFLASYLSHRQHLYSPSKTILLGLSISNLVNDQPELCNVLWIFDLRKNLTVWIFGK